MDPVFVNMKSCILSAVYAVEALLTMDRRSFGANRKDIPAYLPPFWLSPQRAMRVA